VFPFAHVAAVGVAVLSTFCYASSAVLQERESAAQESGGARMVLRLVRRPWWLVAVAATVSGALLHIGALALGPLTLVQPFGVLTLVLALPLGAKVNKTVVTPAEWRAAAAVAVGLAAVLFVAPHHAPPVRLPVHEVLVATAAVAALCVALLVAAVFLSRRPAAVARAAAAAACFGFASAMARATVTAAAPPLVVGSLAVLGAAAGLALAQLAYRTGGLGAPLATQILIDPIVAVLIGVVVLGEPLQLGPFRSCIGILGLVLTTVGIWTLATQHQKVEKEELGRDLDGDVAGETGGTADRSTTQP
jgi:hypothetical protein